jgi:uncharacterized protein (TIGR02246 family)
MDDLEAIEALHAADEAASKAQDYAALRTLLDEDAVVLPPGGRIQRSKEEIDASFARLGNTPRTHEVLEYSLNFEEVQVLDGYAIEWGTIRARTLSRTSHVSTETEYHALRVLRKQPNGTWKVYRSIWAPGPMGRGK